MKRKFVSRKCSACRGESLRKNDVDGDGDDHRQLNILDTLPANQTARNAQPLIIAKVVMAHGRLFQML